MLLEQPDHQAQPTEVLTKFIVEFGTCDPKKPKKKCCKKFKKGKQCKACPKRF